MLPTLNQTHTRTERLETDRETDRKRDAATDTQNETERQTEREMQRQTHRTKLRDRQKERGSDRHTEGVRCLYNLSNGTDRETQREYGVYGICLVAQGKQLL